MRSGAVFVDFDGTITASETFVSALERFAPRLSAELVPRMYARELSLREGVRRLLESIPSGDYPALVDTVRGAELRAGLPELCDFLDARGAPLVVVSGGLRDMVHAALGRLVHRAHAIHAVDVDASGAHLAVRSDLEEGDELVAKARVLERYPGPRVAVGDSVTDVGMARRADLVFARDRLRGYLDELDLAWLPWNDFHDVRAALAARWGAA